MLTPGTPSPCACTPSRTPTQSPHAHFPLPCQVPCPQPRVMLPGAVAFPELVDRMGSKGPFQSLNPILPGLPVLGLATQSLLQISAGTTPAHPCRPPPNASAGPWVLPKGLDGKSERCLRFTYPPHATLWGPPSRAWTAGPTTPAPRPPLSPSYVHRRPFFLHPQYPTHACCAQGQ